MMAASNSTVLHEDGIVETRWAGRSRNASSFTFDVSEPTSEIVNGYLLVDKSQKGEAKFTSPLVPRFSMELSNFARGVLVLDVPVGDV